MNAKNILEIEDLNVEFSTPKGPLKALRNFNLTMSRGAIVGVVGESGCGKSTLINAIIGLLAPNASVTRGRMIFEGVDLLQQSKQDLQKIRGQRISMVSQDPMTALNPILSIGDQMVDIQYRSNVSKSKKRDRSIEMLRMVGIPDPSMRFNDYPHQFSGGMRQRIAIAMALQVEPKLLIADEPTTALDATLEVQIIQRLKELQQNIGCSILFISHHLGVIAELCNYVVVMYGGEIVETGSVRDVFHRASHPYTQKLLECDPARIKEVTNTLPTIPGEVPDLVRLPNGCIFADRCQQSVQQCRDSEPELTYITAEHSARCPYSSHPVNR